MNPIKKAKYIDLSHTIYDGLVTYKGLPATLICDFLSRETSKDYYETGTQFQIGKIEMVANSGTYIDSPFHRYKNGKDISELQLSKFVDVEAVTVTVLGQQAIGPELFSSFDVRGKAVLVRTDWSKHWNTDPYFENHPFLTEAAALALKKSGVKLVGIDSCNIDDTRGKARPVHSILLKEEILIVEHLTNLDKLPKQGYLFNAVPPKFKGVGSFPVRAFAKIQTT